MVEKLVQTEDWYTAGFQASNGKMPIRETVDWAIFGMNTGPEGTFDYFCFFFFLTCFAFPKIFSHFDKDLRHLSTFDVASCI